MNNVEMNYNNVQYHQQVKDVKKVDNNVQIN